MFYDVLLASLGCIWSFIFFILLNLSLGDHNPDARRGSYHDQRANIKMFLGLTLASVALAIIGMLGWGWGAVILPLLLFGAVGVFIICLFQMATDIYHYLRS